jgi:hypothetical protein
MSRGLGLPWIKDQRPIRVSPNPRDIYMGGEEERRRPLCLWRMEEALKGNTVSLKGGLVR